MADATKLKLLEKVVQERSEPSAEGGALLSAGGLIGGASLGGKLTYQEKRDNAKNLLVAPKGSQAALERGAKAGETRKEREKIINQRIAQNEVTQGKKYGDPEVLKFAKGIIRQELREAENKEKNKARYAAEKAKAAAAGFTSVAKYNAWRKTGGVPAESPAPVVVGSGRKSKAESRAALLQAIGGLMI